MAASSNFGNVLTVVGAGVFLTFLPMLPLQLLVQNLLYDLSQTTIPFDSVDAEDLAKPRKWDAQGIARFMLFLGPISSVFDLATFVLMWWIFGTNTVEKQALFQSGWFVEGLLSQTLIVYMLRTRRIPFFQSWPCRPLVLTTLLIMAVGAILPFTSIGAAIGLVRLPTVYFFWLSAILFSYCLVVQVMKIWFLKRFRAWI
jgi:Mg2+-importing ATPase